MTFEWALEQLKAGKAVRRTDWEVPWSHVQQSVRVHNNCLRFTFSQQILWEDFAADDWIEAD